MSHRSASWGGRGTMLLLAVLLLLAPLLVAPAAHADPATEQELLAALDAERSSRGLPPLRVTQDLTDAARAQAERMAAEGRIYHNPSLTTDVTGWLRVSENVGYGPDASVIHGALMSSAGHSANMLDPVVTQVGIGTAWSGSQLYVSQVFRQPDAATADAPGITASAEAVDVPPPAAPVDLGLDACPQEVPTDSFADVPTGTEAAAHVDCAAWWELVEGIGSGRFDPALPVNRAQAASLLARQLQLAGSLPVATRDHFRDDGSTPHQASINALAEVGVLAGTSPGTFTPYRPLSRAQMAAVLVRAHEHVLGEELPVADVPFVDLAGTVHAADIAKAYGAGLVEGMTAQRYGPEGDVTRQNMAAFLVRAVDKLVAVDLVPRP